MSPWRRRSTATVPRALGAATFNAPNGVTLDGAGNVYVADTKNNLIRKIARD